MKKVISKGLLALFMFFLFFNVSAQDEAAPLATVGGSYLIGPGDVLNISVWKEEGMQLEVLVRPDGGITYPLAGEIQAGRNVRLIHRVLHRTQKEKVPHMIDGHDDDHQSA